MFYDKKVNNFILLLTFIFLFFVTPKPTYAETIQKSEVQANILNVRSGPSLNHKIIGKLKFGDTVDVLQQTGEWASISFQNQTAYIHTDYIKPISSWNVQKGKVTASVLNVRNGPSLQHNIIGKLQNGQIIDVTGSNGAWIKTIFENKEAFVHSDYINLEASKNQDETKVEENKLNKEEADNQTIHSKKGKVTASALHIRKEPNTSSAILGKIYKGNEITYYIHNNSWGQVTWNGKTGYVHLDYVQEFSKEKEISQPSEEIANKKEFVVTASALRVRSGPSTSHLILGKLYKNQKIISLQESNGWHKIHYNGKVGYVSNDYVKASSETGNVSNNQKEIGYVTATVLNVRQSPSTTSAIIGKLKQNDKIVIKSIHHSEWGQIEYNGKVGYVSLQYIQKEALSTTEISKTYYVNASALNVRKEPNTQSPRIGKLLNGETVQVVSSSGSWYKIKFNQSVGYVHSDYLVETKKETQHKTSLTGKTIVLDAGHGGRDVGGVGNGLYEKDVVLNITQKVANKLRNAGANVVLTRNNDAYLSLSERTYISNRSSGDIFVSIHANISSYSNVRGIETFYYGAGDAGRKQKSISLAQHIQQHLIQKVDTRNRGAKPGNFQVLRSNHLPSVLVEVGFLSNAYEANQLKTVQHQDKIADGIFQGIQAYFK